MLPNQTRTLRPSSISRVPVFTAWLCKKSRKAGCSGRTNHTAVPGAYPPCQHRSEELLAWIIREAICEISTRHAVGYDGVVSTAGLPAGFGAGGGGSGSDRRLG